MENDFGMLQTYVDEMKATSSSNKKKDILQKWKDNDFVMKILLYVNNPYWTYGVTSSAIKKFGNKAIGKSTGSIFTLLDQLRKRELSGHAALMEVNTYIANDHQHRQLILNIVDKDIETRANASLINKVKPGYVPEFKVALAKPYEEKLVDFKKQEWYTSRKLDGVRCVCRIENGNIQFFSRTGKNFYTLGVIEKAIRDAGMENANIVLDGEVCIIDKDGKENFQSIMKEIRKKTPIPEYIPVEQDKKYLDKKGMHQIKNPKFFVFDCLTTEEFDRRESSVKLETRLKRIPENIQYFEKLNQDFVHGIETLNYFKGVAQKNSWEGVMLRMNVGYKGKRSNDLLKVKTFFDDEYRVLETIDDTMRFFEGGKDVDRMTMAAVLIHHKGFEVKVGSGFSKAEREIYYNNPEEIIGKLITVQYFEETTNQDDDAISLRFPTFKCIHGVERVV